MRDEEKTVVAFPGQGAGTPSPAAEQAAKNLTLRKAAQISALARAHLRAADQHEVMADALEGIARQMLEM